MFVGERLTLGGSLFLGGLLNLPLGGAMFLG